MHTNEIKDKFIELRLKGHSLADIANTIGVSKTTLVDWNRRYQEELRELRSAELEALHDRILHSYAADFARLDRLQRGVDEYLNDKKPSYIFRCDNVLDSDQIIRAQIRQMRKDIELFGRITNDAKNPTPSVSKSETANTPSLKPEISNLKSPDAGSENLTIS